MSTRIQQLARHCWLSLVCAAIVACAIGQSALGKAPLRVCLVSGSLEYDSNESLAKLQQGLESNYNVECSRAFIVDKDETRLPGLENLDNCDVALLFTRRLKLSGDDLERIKRYCTSGRPLVGVRTASHAVQPWLALDKEVLGGNYQGHYSNEIPTEVSIVAEQQDNPLLAGFIPFRSAGSLYKNQGIADDCQVLLRGTTSEATEPIAWTRMHNGGRIFYTSLGHQKDFDEASFRRLVTNALFWAAGREPEPRKGK